MKPKKQAKNNTESVTEIPRRAEIDSFAGAAETDALASLAFVERLEIQKPADREFASNALAEIAKQHDVIEAKRVSWVKPLKAVTSDIDATFRPVTKALKQAIETLKTKIGAWDVEQDQARAALLKGATLALRSGDNEGAAEKLAEAEAHVHEGGGASSKIVWTGEVVDADAIPREFLMPDLGKLEAVTAAMGKDPGISGWRAFPTAQVRTSRKGAA